MKMDEIMDSRLSVEQFGQISPQLQDSFKPQKIFADFSITPIKENTESVRSFKSLNLVSSENQQFQQSAQPPRNSIHIKKLNRNSERFLFKKEKIQSNTLIQQKHQSRIYKMFQKETLTRKFIDKLRKSAYILPQVIPIKMKTILQENYTDTKRSLAPSKRKQSSKKELCPILNPTGLLMIFWNILQALQLIFLMWWFPFKVAFKPPYSIVKEETVLIYMFLCDIVLKLNQGFIKEGEFVMSRLAIVKHYIGNELTVDVIYFVSQLFLTIDVFEDIQYVYQILVVIQFGMNFVKLKAKIKKFEETFATQSSYTQLADLISLIVTVFYFAHFMACTWYYVGVESLNVYDVSWTTQANFQNSDPTTFYLYSFYWATTTMVTVGYGDISAKNQQEVLCATLLMIFSTGMFAFAINQIGEIFTNIDAEKQSFKRSLLLINQYMKKNDVDQQIQSRVRNYLKFQEKFNKQTQNEELEQIFQKLPSNLHEDLQRHIQSKIIEEVSFYKYHFSKQTIQNISSNLQILSFTPKEVIFQQGQFDDCSLFTVWKGEVMIVDNQTNKVLATLKKGQCFGETEFLAVQSRQFSAISKDLSQILKMPRELFLKIIKNSQQDVEQFHKLKDLYMFQKINYISQCYCCSENHFITDCSVCFYKPNIEALLKRQQAYETWAERGNCRRRSFKKTFCQFQTFKSESEDKQEQQIQGGSSSPSVKEVSVNARTPTRHKTNNVTFINHKSFGYPQLFQIDEERNQDERNHNSMVEFQIDNKQSIHKILELPSLKNKQTRMSNGLIVISSMNQLDQIQQEFFKDFFQDFEIIHQFDNYFPHNNIDVVILKLKKSSRNKRLLITETGGEYTRKKLQTEARLD